MPTVIENIYPIIGIAPPEIRRQVAAEVEKTKQQEDPQHPMYAHPSQPARINSRKSFLKSTSKLETQPKARRLDLWKDKVTSSPLEIKEEGSAGFQLPFLIWKTLNRLRTGTTRCKTAIMK